MPFKLGAWVYYNHCADDDEERPQVESNGSAKTKGTERSRKSDGIELVEVDVEKDIERSSKKSDELSE